MASDSLQTWETVWAPLLKEAASRSISNDRTHGGFGQYAAAIILAKASWEAFQNEFVESRELAEDIKGMYLQKAIPAICRALNIKEFTFSQGSLWEALLLQTRLRNAIVHHDAKPRQLGEAPKDLVKSLARLGVIHSSNLGLSWERVLVTATTAQWSCSVVGNAILELENIPNHRRRSFTLVHEQVFDAIGHALDSWHQPLT